VIAVVRHKGLIALTVENRPVAEFTQPALAQGQGEGRHLDRQLAARSQLGDEFFVANQDDQPAGGSRDNLLADQCPAVALDQVKVSVHLISPIDVRSRIPASARVSSGTPSCRASRAVSSEVGTPWTRKLRLRRRSPRALTKDCAARPEPRPIREPFGTNSSARSMIVMEDLIRTHPVA